MKGPPIEGANLRLEQRSHEERVLRQFNSFNAGVIGTGCDRKSVGDEPLNVGRRETKAAPVKSRKGLTTANRMHSSPWDSGHGALLRHETAAQSIDDQRLLPWGRFGMTSINETGDISGELDDGVLKPATRPHEWLP
jgi:hypothetical protein